MRAHAHTLTCAAHERVKVGVELTLVPVTEPHGADRSDNPTIRGKDDDRTRPSVLIRTPDSVGASARYDRLPRRLLLLLAL